MRLQGESVMKKSVLSLINKDNLWGVETNC